MRETDLDDEYENIESFISKLPGEIERIAICAASYTDIGGVSRVIEQHATELVGAGYDVDIFALETSRASPNGADLHTLGYFETTPYKELDKFAIFGRWQGLDLISDLGSFDLVITHRFPFPILANISQITNDFIHIFWSHPSKASDEHFSGVARLWAKVQHHLETKNYAVRNADYICAVSDESRSYIEAKTGRDASVVPNTITESRFEDVTDEEIINERFGLSPEDTVVLHVGRISPRKNIHNLVNVFQEATTGEDNCKLILVGEQSMPEYSERVREGADDNTVLTGFVDDETLSGLYNRSDVYATCSLSEGWGLPLSEASYFDLEIIAFESIPAVHSLKNSHKIAEEDYDEFGEKLNQVIDTVTVAKDRDE